MRKVIASEWMSLDGVVQAPINADEDTTGGFKHGGWHRRYFEEVAMKWVVENVTQAGGFLLGRRTYDLFAAHWPEASVEEQTLAVPMNTLPKYVASRTLKEPLRWQNSHLLRGEIAGGRCGFEARTRQGPVCNREHGVGVTCSPKSDPGVMRVSTAPQGQENLDEAEATQSRANHHEAA